MKNLHFTYLATVLFILSCNHPKKPATNLDQDWLNSIIEKSDSSYSKPYYRTDFVMAYYYINKKDSTLCQMMKDSAGLIRQIIITKKDIRTFFGQYYSNGQLQAELPLDNYGHYHGPATYYYKNGIIQSRGIYKNGLKNGKWDNYDEKGKLISLEEYDEIGQLIKTITL
jgi:antitoxin component YwqK of YwqJK toxin-antitoxin module